MRFEVAPEIRFGRMNDLPCRYLSSRISVFDLRFFKVEKGMECFKVLED